MRHIPEEELHAYLDQALSRSQCVEIESHLAGCRRCRLQRDEIAALRDRTTALLSSLGPSTTLPPPFEVIRARHEQVRLRRQRWLIAGAWAASVALALAGGWQANLLLFGAPEPVSLASALVPSGTDHALRVRLSSAPATATPAKPSTRTKSAPRNTAPTQPAPIKPSEPDHLASVQATASENSAPATALGAPAGGQLALEVSSLPTPSPLGNLDGLWRTVPLSGGISNPTTDMPHVAGLPVVQVQVQKTSPEEEITSVEQQLATGEVIRTIEGPASRVTALLARSDPTDSPVNTDSSGARKGDMTLTVRQGDRMLAVTGPSTVLGTLMSRVSVRRRY